MTIYHKFGFVFNSETGNNKKYKVISPLGKTIYFGDRSFSQYHDRIGEYASKDHYNLVRRNNYRTRHRNDYINDPEHSGYYSWHFLW